MDKEKAIQMLKRCEAESHCEHYKRHYCCIGCGQREALDLAIEALGQTESGDCISRQDAIEALTGWETEPLDEDIVRTLEALPPVPQKQIASKLESDEIATSEGEESTMSQPKSKLYIPLNQHDLFNKSFWRMGMHDSNVRPRTMADTSTNEGDAESATTNLYDVQLAKDLLGISEEAEKFQLSEETSTNDCISRQQAIEALDRIGSVDTEADREYARDIFDNLPPVTPTERTGEWKAEGDCGITRCGQCGWSIEEYIEWNYCPNCGAKMKGGTENE